MTKIAPKKIAFVSSFLPRKCGIATFANDLINSLQAYADTEFQPLVVAMSNDKYQYGRLVELEIRPTIKSDYLSAAEYLNFSNVSAVSIQHEYGLFGGAAGDYLSLFLDNINAPVITTMHTVLAEPDADYYKATLQLCNSSDKIIVMNTRGIKMLVEVYGINIDKIELIPHGLPDLPFVDSSYYKHKFGFDGKRTIMTFGLIGRGKGLEVMLRAMPEIIKHHPDVLYIILGVTHPELIKFEGQAYRLGLQRMVKELGIEKNVIFYNRFVSNSELSDFLCATDIYVTPYLNKEQLTSGTLSFAVGSGKAVVSTPYWAAEELLADGRGKLVKFSDSADTSSAINQILSDEQLFNSMRRRAYDYGRSKTWSKLGQPYWKIFSRTIENISAVYKSDKAEPSHNSKQLLELPEPSLEHLQRLTDDTGLLQHAKYIIPDRANGYCTDDNARALIVMTKFYKQYHSEESKLLLDKYLSFICHSFKPDGSVANFMSYDRKFWSSQPENDALGRVIWSLGNLIANPPAPLYLSITKNYFDRAIKHIPDISPRGMCYSILGLANYLTQFPGAAEAKRMLSFAADFLVNLHQQYSCTEWDWFENILAYDNAIMPAALYKAAVSLGEKKYLKLAERSCEFLLSQIYTDNHFSFVGSDGWYPKTKPKAQFAQQPLEVASTVIMLQLAYQSTLKREYLQLLKKAFDWFIGENDLQISVYDFQTKGCCDGLESGGVNINQGAESMVSFLMSLLTVSESTPTVKNNFIASTSDIEDITTIEAEGIIREDSNI